jgi:hypothetical protein
MHSVPSSMRLPVRSSTSIASRNHVQVPRQGLLAVLLLLATSVPATVRAQYCEICPDATKNGVRGASDFYVPYPTRTVPNYSDGTKTCSFLQTTVEDVLRTGGSDGESRHCINTQWLACEAGCCGPAGAEYCFGGNIKDPNPACDICAGQTFSFVPAVNAEKTAKTKNFGTQNCEGLYNAAAEGIFTANWCPIIQSEAGPQCCNLDGVTPLDQDLPAFNSGGGGGRSPTPAPVRAPTPAPVPAPTPAVTTTCGEQAYREAYPDVTVSWRGTMRSHYIATGRRKGYQWIDCDAIVSRMDGLCGDELYKSQYADAVAKWPYGMRSHFQLYGKSKGFVWVDC